MPSTPFALRAIAAASLLVSASAWAGQPAAKAAPAAPAAPAPAATAAADAKAAAVPAAPQARPKRQAEVMEALLAANKELQPTFPWRAPMGAMAEQLGSFRYSPDTSAKLVKIFGTDQPLRFTRSGKPGDYTVTLQALDYTSPDKSRVTWPAAQGTLHVDPSGRSLSFAGAWPSVTYTEGDGGMTMEGMSLTVKQQRGIDDIPLGSADFRMDAIRVAGKTPLVLAKAHFGGDMRQRGKLLDVSYRFGIGSIRVDKLDIGSLAFGVTLQGIPGHVMAKLYDIADSKQTPDELQPAQARMAKAMFRSVVASGGAVRLDELRYTLNGQSAWLKGEMRVKALKDDDELKADEVFRQLSGRFEMRVPVSLLAEISRTFARQELEKRAGAGKPVTEDQVRQASQLMTDVMIGKMIGQGYATLEKEVIVSTVDIGDGKVFANGKQVQMPNFGASNGGDGATDEPADDESTGETPADEDAAS